MCLAPELRLVICEYLFFTSEKLSLGAIRRDSDQRLDHAVALACHQTYMKAIGIYRCALA